MDSFITWIIIAAFYAPLHFAGPVGAVLLTTPASKKRTRLIRYVIIESAVSMLLAFALVIWLVADSLGIAMLILILSMFIPYLFLFLHKFFQSQA